MPNLINNGIGLVLDKANLGTKPWQITVKLMSWQGNEREPLAVVGIGTDGSSAVLAPVTTTGAWWALSNYRYLCNHKIPRDCCKSQKNQRAFCAEHGKRTKVSICVWKGNQGALRSCIRNRISKTSTKEDVVMWVCNLVLTERAQDRCDSRHLNCAVRIPRLVRLG